MCAQRAPLAVALARAGWLVLVLVASGCGPRFGNVSGTVKYQGKPMSGGSIIFFDAGNRSVSGAIGSDGRYSVTNVTAGRARIAVFPPMAIPFKELQTGPTMDPAGDQVPPPAVPPRYGRWRDL